MTGSGVIGLFYKDGVVLGFNDAAGYHGYKKFENLQRHHIVNQNTVFGRNEEIVLTF